MALLTLENVHVSLGDRHLLQGVSLVVVGGERIGLLGSNGCGKSTLLRVTANEPVLDAGERTAFARLLLADPDLLRLDEPTNNLDLASLRALEDAQLAFADIAIVVSHDRWFLDCVATHIVHLDGDGGVRVRATCRCA